MLSKKQKVNKKLFEEVFNEGRVFHSDFLYLKISLLENKSDKSKFAFTISKKIAKKASDRNLIKRRGFAILRENKENILNGFVIIFFTKKGIEKLKYTDFKNEVILLLKKANLISI